MIQLDRTLAAADTAPAAPLAPQQPDPTEDSAEARVERIVGYRFRDRGLVSQALVHASVAATRLESNERLEFLGDAILGMLVCDYLFRTFPKALEGDLTKIKSNVVSRRSCAEIAVELGLDAELVLGKGMGDRTTMPQSLAAAAFEAVIGAMYLDGGLEPVRDFVLRHVIGRIDRAARLGHQHNFKSVLQQSLQRAGIGNPTYVVVDQRGPDHAKCFEIAVEVQRRRFASCWATSKKQAEQQAALAALIELGIASTSDEGETLIREVVEGEQLPIAHPEVGRGGSGEEPSGDPAVQEERCNRNDGDRQPPAPRPACGS
jgi:ribonuclease-3